MKASTHTVGGIALALVAIPHLQSNPENAGNFFTAAVLGGAYLGSLFPDLDHPKSRIGKLLPVLSKPLSKIFGHRKFLHSFTLLFIIAMMVNVYNLSSSLPRGFGEGFCLGFFSHIFLDALTTNGVYPFWPLKRKIRLSGIRTSSKLETLTMILLSAFSMVKGIQLFAPSVYAVIF